MGNEIMMKTDRTKRAAAFLVALCLLIAGCIPLACPSPCFAAEEQEQTEVLMSNGQGQQVVLRVEEELTKEEMALQSKTAGVLDLDDSEVPLAGFDDIAAGVRQQSVHLQWMLLLLLAAVVFAVCSSRWDTRIFELRRQVADAEHEIQLKGRRRGGSNGK